MRTKAILEISQNSRCIGYHDVIIRLAPNYALIHAMMTPREILKLIHSRDLMIQPVAVYGFDGKSVKYYPRLKYYEEASRWTT